ncbi:MAG: hypothetical protein ACXWM5_19320, partial [Vulcanimicrobiaceae bacterium]
MRTQKETNVPGIDEMVSRLRNVSETLHWVAAECKKPPTVERVLEFFEALKTTDDALPIIEFGKQMGVPDAQDVRQSLASTLI